MRRDDAYLLDIHPAVRDISRFVAGMSLAEFKANRMAQSAVIRELILIGEAAGQTSLEGQASHPAIPWQDLARLRNFYVHVYHRIDIARLWDNATTLIPQIEKITTAKFPDQEQMR
jgi:uncharacterized protein with HEPN domain